MMDFLTQPWPWWIVGPLIGLMVPAMFWIGNRQFGVSSNLRHMCAAALPARIPFLQYDWRRHGLWNLTFALGIVLGAALTGFWADGPPSPAIADATRADLAGLGIESVSGWVPAELFSFSTMHPVGLATLIAGGFLVGFGARYAGGCTSGHAITGLSLGRVASLVAVLGFFAGGLISTHVLLPLLFGGAP